MVKILFHKVVATILLLLPTVGLIAQSPGQIISTFNDPTAASGEFKTATAGYGVYGLAIDPVAGTLLVGGRFVCSTTTTAVNVIGLSTSTNGLASTTFSVGAGAPGANLDANGRVNSVHYVSSTAAPSGIASFILGGDFLYYSNSTSPNGTNNGGGGMTGVAYVVASSGLPSNEATYLGTPSSLAVVSGGTSGNTVNVVSAFPVAAENGGTQRVFIGGNFTSVINSSSSSNHYICYKNLPNTNGTGGGSYDKQVNCIAFGNNPGTNGANRPDIFVGGKFTTIYSPAVHRLLARYSTTGSSFFSNNLLSTVPTINDGTAVNAIAVNSTGQVLIAGDFTSITDNTTSITYTVPGLARFNNDGSVDASFNTKIGTGPNSLGSINAIAISPYNQNIVLGGSFTSFNGTANTKMLLVLNTDGSVNTVFATNAGTGPNAQVRALAIDANADLYIGGDFTSYNGTNVNYVAKVTGGIVLPISLSSFRGFSKVEGVQLAWQTNSETNNNYFSIERSIDGAHFIEMAQTKGSGTTNEIHNYDYLDYSPRKGRNYYKIKQTDFDGKTTYSEIISVVYEFDTPISIYPNPSSETLNISFSGSYSARMTDVMGNEILLYQHNEGDQPNIQINTSEYPKGIYIMTFYLKNKIITEKIIVP